MRRPLAKGATSPRGRRRRLRVPAGVRLYFADVSEAERTWVGGVPLTSPLRTLADCMAAHVSPEFIHAAREQILRRGLASPAELRNFQGRLHSAYLGSNTLM